MAGPNLEARCHDSKYIFFPISHKKHGNNFKETVYLKESTHLQLFKPKKQSHFSRKLPQVNRQKKHHDRNISLMQICFKILMS
jgi:hypothetical protein